MNDKTMDVPLSQPTLKLMLCMNGTLGNIREAVPSPLPLKFFKEFPSFISLKMATPTTYVNYRVTSYMILETILKLRL